ncbi:ABC transporter ATP-binding protein [Nitrosophilus kaiyonis]|uniref:ABC transporter ATP-binding protein n=1 Tax=Nitrosophilus kaiyonis TaxID=2930200 RepID=UPI002492780D|nr:ABC transporter ATP-binding protein [Nitrosophilus kaiyonis]
MQNLYSWKKIFNILKKEKKNFLIAQFLAILATAASVPTPLLMPVLVDEILLNKPGFVVHTIDTFLGAGSKFYYTSIVLMVVLFLRFTYSFLNIAQNKIFETIAKNITYKIREDVLNHLKKVSMKEYELLGSGSVASRLVTDINTIDSFLSISISRFLISLLSLIGISIVLLFIHWKLAIFILFLNPAVVIFATKLARIVSKLKKEENSAVEMFQKALIETLDLFEQIRAANKENDFFRKIVNKAKFLKEKSINFSWKSDAASRLSFLVFVSGFEVFRAAGIIAVAYSDLSIGLMLAIFGYLWFMMTPIQEILGIQYAYKNATVALNRINELLKLQKEPQYPHLKNPFKKDSKISIELKNVYFGYNKEKIILNDINMIIKGGEKTAIVGASGSGKTTLSRILVGFYPIDKGDIFYNSISIKEIGLDVVRENVSLVLQTPTLFNDTIKFNLTLGKDIEDKKIYEALKMAQIYDEILEMEDGLQTVVGVGGVRLSGGQRQRIAIARMILQDPKVVILDESTSAIDMDTEKRLFESLNKFLENRTTIIIAHRLSTIKQADFIYILDNGKIIKSGEFEKFKIQRS